MRKIPQGKGSLGDFYTRSGQDSNPRHLVPKTSALSAELPEHACRIAQEGVPDSQGRGKGRRPSDRAGCTMTSPAARLKRCLCPSHLSALSLAVSCRPHAWAPELY